MFAPTQILDFMEMPRSVLEVVIWFTGGSNRTPHSISKWNELNEGIE